jgi:exopolysaccharide biosynthesis operon protein EpsL
MSRNGFVLALSIALAAPWAAAQDPAPPQERPIMLRLDTTLSWDSNVYRLPAGAPDPQLAQGKTGKSDQVATLTLALRLDKSLGQQNFVLEASQTAHRYAKFRSLDHNASQYQGAWLWSLTPRLRGSLSFEHSEAQIPFSDLGRTELNLRTIDRQAFSVDAWAFGGWHLLAGTFNNEVKTTREFLAQPSYVTRGGDVGLRYDARSGSSVTVTARAYRGRGSNGLDFVNVIDDAFEVREGEAKVIWLVTGKSTLTGRVTRIEQRHDNFAQRDFSGTAGEIAHDWDVNGRLRINLSAARSVLPWTENTQASYRIDHRLALAPSLRLSDRTLVRVLAYRMDSDFLGPVAPLTGPARRDALSGAWLGVEWSPPLRNLLLTASAQHLRRSSNAPGLDFEATIILLTATLKF